MNRRIALPIVLLTLPFALGAGVPSALADGPGVPSFATGYHPMSGATSGPPNQPVSVDSGPAIVAPASRAAASTPAVNAAVKTENASALPIGVTDLVLLGGAIFMLLAIAELFRRSAENGRGSR